ncbi:glycosyltransferase [bacterium]|nr:glycosyltransferase [bacterium]
MAEPIITVITPVYNLVEKEQLDAFNLQLSLLDLQTYPHIEHIVMDKASTDGTLEVLKDYKNKGYIQLFSGKDTGKFNALNEGIMHSTGKYVTFLSCDDFIHDITAFADIVNLLEANDGDFTFAPAYCRHPQGFTFLFMPSMYNVFQVLPCARQAMVFKKSVLVKENYFDEKFKYFADFDLVIRLVMKKYTGLYFDTNYVTYKFSNSSVEDETRLTNESKLIYYKNYRTLYPDLNEELLDKMSRLSEFPQPLLEKLSTYFPEADKQLFFDRCEEMHQIRLNAANMAKNKNQSI